MAPSCVVCKQDYNEAGRAPLLLNCGHIICEECARNEELEACPFDKSPLGTSNDRSSLHTDLFVRELVAAHWKLHGFLYDVDLCELALEPWDLVVSRIELGKGGWGRVQRGWLHKKQVRTVLPTPKAAWELGGQQSKQWVQANPCHLCHRPIYHRSPGQPHGACGHEYVHAVECVLLSRLLFSSLACWPCFLPPGARSRLRRITAILHAWRARVHMRARLAGTYHGHACTYLGFGRVNEICFKTLKA